MAKSTHRVLSEIFRDVAQVFFASVVVTPLLTSETAVNWLLVRFGLGMALVSWLLAVTMGEKGKI
ncbi:hypothetical protein COX09_04475 [Candidatus Beckwithbacteria bacterium CG23_combo_of_CG06-09_8_20_14_all_47_9]|uniref:MFS transporter n=1 Tax=Candidatus Beckwithbacteria bacterium CG23_combo_of_CG06-09_8_20_14_all_47_9 TaxID=1974498 RepID=A0A2H0B2N8_9BACT|nr:MAG: hypothetical protein COX09_04475 [Candidatus Beckwithbacteria bacterium CG23_combo_of_CG06-09_8_20_14_all_47_9]